MFLFVGRMMWYKGLRISLDALAALMAQGRDFRMVFVGGGGDLDEVKEYASSLGLDGRVFFVGPVHDRDLIRAWYCRADMFLFPSTFDTNGLVVREAAACGLGSVLIKGSCAAEDVTDGQNGLLIEENAQSMAAMLSRLMNAPGTMARVGENAQKELYMSWGEAVARAYERYGVVVENYRSHKPKHDTVTDGLVHGMAAALDGINRGRELLGQAEDELVSGYGELKALIEGEKRKIMAWVEDLTGRN